MPENWEVTDTKPLPISHIKIGMIFYFTELHERSEVVVIDADWML